MNLVNSVDSVSPLDENHKDNIFNLFVTLNNLYLDVLVFQWETFHLYTKEGERI